MFFLNLTLAEFLTLFGAVSVVVVSLYLLERSWKRQTVATLRFWIPSQKPAESRRRRRKIQQPLSLLLQILSLALLLLALAQLRLGSPGLPPRDHVLILDTSAWMGARSGRGTLMDEARRLARAYIRALPSADRVMLVRADALATPATVFEANRKSLEEAIVRSRPGATALNLDQALEFARQVEKLHARRPGEIVFVGAGRISQQEAASLRPAPPNLRVLRVPSAIENCGLRQIGLRRAGSNPDLWEIFVSVRNYGKTPRTVQLTLHFGGASVGARRLNLKPGADENTTFQYRARAAGWLEARLLTQDAFPEDDRAVLELPQQRALRVAVYSDEPSWLRPLLAANPRVEAVFRSPSEYKVEPDAEIVILDRFRPLSIPKTDSLWIEPPVDGSPVAVRATLSNVKLARWRSDHPLATGLRAKDVRLASAQVYEAAPGDIPVAEVESGPVILARPGKPRMVVFGFHPARSAMRYELATPLLFANILRWMSPEIFRRWELNAGSLGSVDVILDPGADNSLIRVLADNQAPLPFTVQGRTLRFFAGTPGTVRVITGDRELVYSLTLPQVAESEWEPPQEARRGLPTIMEAEVTSRDLWPFLAVLGALGLLAEWLLFGSSKPRHPSRFAGGFRNRLPRLGGRISGSIRKAS